MTYFFGQLLGREDLALVVRHQPDLAGARERKPVLAGGVGHVVHLVAAAGEEAGADHRLVLHERGGGHRREAVLLDHPVEGVAEHGLVQPHAHAGEHVAARARGADAAVEVDEAETLAKVGVRLGLEAAVVAEALGGIEIVGLPPSPLHVARGVGPHRHVGVGGLGDEQPEPVACGVGLAERLSELLLLGLDGVGPLLQVGEAGLHPLLVLGARRLQLRGGLAHGLAQLVLLGDEFLEPGPHGAGRRVGLDQLVHQLGVAALVGDALAEAVRVLAELLEVDHARKVEQGRGGGRRGRGSADRRARKARFDRRSAADLNPQAARVLRPMPEKSPFSS